MVDNDYLLTNIPLFFMEKFKEGVEDPRIEIATHLISELNRTLTTKVGKDLNELVKKIQSALSKEEMAMLRILGRESPYPRL